MQDDVVIKVENISKRYEIGETSSFVTLRDKLIELPSRIFKGPKRTKTFWALKDVSFEVRRGEVVGIIGKNGAGKSTLLKILARITEPTSGRITMHGRVASMLEVGTGFNPELTGRENIYLNGAIIGMARKEIDAKFQDIVEFSGIGKFLDTPVKHYSSGMYVRLAFAVSAHLDADILLVDEVLAVGDAEFQKKCLGKMSDLAHSGRTVIFVSHNLNSLNSLCNRAVVIDNSRPIFVGTIKSAIIKYQSLFNSSSSPSDSHCHKKFEQITFMTPTILNKLGIKTKKIEFNENFEIKINYVVVNRIENVRIGFSILDENGTIVSVIHDADSNRIKNRNIKPGSYSDSVTVENILMPGNYYIGVGAHQTKKDGFSYYTPNIKTFTITKPKDENLLPISDQGEVKISTKWNLNEKTK